MPANTKKDASLQYKGHPLVRKDNVIYYGSMTDSHIIMMQILDTKKDNGLDIASRVSVPLAADRSRPARPRPHCQKYGKVQHVERHGYRFNLARSCTVL